MKYFLVFFAFLISSALAQSTPKPSVPNSPTSPSAPMPTPDQRVIVIDTDDRSGEQGSKTPFVESGSAIIYGKPQENLKVAYRSWEEACANWKKELKLNNAANLLIASCGQPQRRQEKIELVNYYTIESKGEYKIKIGCE